MHTLQAFALLPVVVLKARKFALLFSIGSLSAITSVSWDVQWGASTEYIHSFCHVVPHTTALFLSLTYPRHMLHFV